MKKVCALVVTVLVWAGTSVSHAAEPPKDVKAKIVLVATNVRAGRSVKGKLVLTNTGTQPVDLNQGCTPKWDIVLGKGKRAPRVAFSLECGTRPFVLKPGTTTLKFTADTKDSARGKYHAFLVASDPSFPHAKPAPVTIVAAS